MNILIVVGARPNFMKVAPIIAAIKQHDQRVSVGFADLYQGPVETIQHILVHTGQHYDDLMSGAFFRDLSLPKPNAYLGVGSGSHATQTAEIMKTFEQVLLTEKPDVVLLVGDVNSTLACALVTAKISFDSAGSRPLIVHVEAGLRSFDRSMPEEINRILTDQVSDLLFVTEESALQNLRNEGVSPTKIHFVGNTMIDSLLAFKEKAEASTILDKLKLRVRGRNNDGCKSIRPYALLTLHRPSNVDNRDVFLNILAGLEELATNCPVIFPVHPRTQRRIRKFGFEFRSGVNARKRKGNARGSGNCRDGIILTHPLGYLDFLCLMKHATLVVTDSGGIQEETTCLGIPCVTVRDNTERPVTIEKGTNIIAGTDAERIKDAVRRQTERKSADRRLPEKWDGQAATRIVAALIQVHHEKSLPRQALVA
ncbi:MAG: UDP-N-acetylglucosamine 2-epimerase (non-hydrolyzing) [Acidobacteria bacterium]|nr:MAG: UDP-N-acetylglucosamine 2-epimerase (non-hydrolyzing) [Acidobacteriota bacterium]